MFRFSSLYAIGKEIGREPYLDSKLECVSWIFPELSAGMPNFFKHLNPIVSEFIEILMRYLVCSKFRRKTSQFWKGLL